MDNEQTGKLILDKGQLKRRCTMIPLNKIQGRPIDPATVMRAERLVSKCVFAHVLLLNIILKKKYYYTNFPTF